MEKRAVRISMPFWKEQMTQGNRYEHVECTKELPNDAVLIGSFLEGMRLSTCTLVLLLEAENWDLANDTGYSIQAPWGEQVPEICPEFRTRRAPKEQVCTIEWVECEQEHRLRIKGVGYPSVSLDFEAHDALLRSHMFPLDHFAHSVEDVT